MHRSLILCVLVICPLFSCRDLLSEPPAKQPEPAQAEPASTVSEPGVWEGDVQAKGISIDRAMAIITAIRMICMVPHTQAMGLHKSSRRPAAGIDGHCR